MSKEETTTIQTDTEETVDVVVKVPKALMKMIEEQNYFGQGKEHFLNESIRAMTSNCILNLVIEDAEKLKQRYGKTADVYFSFDDEACVYVEP